MPATKPTASVTWASSGGALKLSLTQKLEQWGWSTSTNTVGGTPEKPILQYENGWRWAVYQWINYLTEKTDEQTPDQTGKSGLFLASVTGVPTWISPYPTIAAGDVTDKKTLVATTASTDPTKTQVSWGYPWSTPGATTDANPLVFAFNTGGYLWQTMYPAITANGLKHLRVNSGATGVEWATAYEVPTPASTGQVLQSTGSTAGAFSWAAPSFAGSVITSGTVDRARLPIYQGATAGAAGLTGSVPASLAGDQDKFLNGAGAWTTITQLPSQTSQAGKFLTTDGTTASWAVNYSVPTPSGTGLFLKSTGATAGQFSWQAGYEVPTPSGAGLILQSSGASAGNYAWTTPSFTADKISGGTVGQLLTSDGTKGTWSSLTAAQVPVLDAAKITTGTFATAQIPSLDAAKITTGTFLSSQIPSLDAAKITTGTIANARIGAFTGATSGAASSTGGIPVAAAGDQGKFLRGDATWQALQVAGMLTSVTSGTQSLDFSSWNTVSCLAISGSITFTFTGLSGGRILTIVLKTASGTQNIVWPSGVKWADGLPLTAATATASTVTLVAYGPSATDVYATAIRTYS